MADDDVQTSHGDETNPPSTGPDIKEVKIISGDC